MEADEEEEDEEEEETEEDEAAASRTDPTQRGEDPDKPWIFGLKLGYTTGWLLFRSGWVWWAVMLNALMILVNYTYAMPTVTTDNFEVTASPDIAPWRYFFIDTTGVIRTNDGAPADASSPPIN